MLYFSDAMPYAFMHNVALALWLKSYERLQLCVV